MKKLMILMIMLLAFSVDYSAEAKDGDKDKVVSVEGTVVTDLYNIEVSFDFDEPSNQYSMIVFTRYRKKVAKGEFIKLAAGSEIIETTSIGNYHKRYASVKIPVTLAFLESIRDNDLKYMIIGNTKVKIRSKEFKERVQYSLDGWL